MRKSFKIVIIVVLVTFVVVSMGALIGAFIELDGTVSILMEKQKQTQSKQGLRSDKLKRQIDLLSKELDGHIYGNRWDLKFSENMIKEKCGECAKNSQRLEGELKRLREDFLRLKKDYWCFRKGFCN